MEASELSENSPGGGAAVNPKNEGGGGSDSGGLGEGERARGEEGDRNNAGNRWPREETLALLKIRSEMDTAFRDSTLKAPLWDEVSRKLGELGYHRNAKKCKEKFENIYKYHRRTKEGRSGRHNSKNYRFFEQLELLDNQSSLPSSSSSQAPIQQIVSPETTMAMPISSMATKAPQHFAPCLVQNTVPEFTSTSTSTTSSSEDKQSSEGGGIARKKRKLEDYFENLMKQVLEKQETLQNKFMEAIEKSERDRVAREESWKIRELARIKEEQERLSQERAVAAAKDAALIAFLQKISEQSSLSSSTQLSPELPIQKKNIEKQENGNNATESGGNNASSSRWPKAEVEALIRLRTDLDLQYQDNGPKGPLWEEISLGMKRMGYDRSSKRCKEKWENINKYYKRVRESNKKRPQDSKTCPYFHMLESLSQMKSKKTDSNNNNNNMKPEAILMEMMAQRDNPLEQQLQPRSDQSVTEDGDGDDDDDDDEEDNGGDYQIVANNPSSIATIE